MDLADYSSWASALGQCWLDSDRRSLEQPQEDVVGWTVTGGRWSNHKRAWLDSDLLLQVLIDLNQHHNDCG